MDQQSVVAAALASRYVVEREIGSGGVATVYLAQDPRHGRRVAVKVLRPEVAASLGAEHFLREIHIAAGLSHPHILAVYDSGEAPVESAPGAAPASLLYYVMPYVEGGSLRHALARQPQLPLEWVLAITDEVADALECAHRHGVVHRDIKPENILFQEGHAALADFGIARPVGHDELVTDPGMFLGTPAYMSPEACEGAELDGRADQYGLACMVYEMLTGQPPFVAALPQAVMVRHVADRVPPLTIVRPDLPAAMDDVFTRALAKTPGQRFPSVTLFAQALGESAAGHAAAALRSVAVLPFANLGGLPEDEALSDGITDEIIAALARIEGLRVASRTSVYALKGRRESVGTLAGLLHVGVVLEGSIRRQGGRLRVAVQLVNGADDRTLWAEHFERGLRDVFAIQDEIAAQVARALRVILRRDAPAGRRVPTADVGAYEYYLRGRQYARLTRRKTLRFAREMFERAIGIDPDFALAWSGVAIACCTTHLFYPHDSDEELAAADRASRRALELAPDLSDAHAARGFALWRLHREEEALAEFATARRLDPLQFEARYVAARLCFQRGDAALAAELFEEAARVDEDYQARFFAAQSYEALGRAAEAEAAYRRALHVAEQHLAMNPDDPRAATMRAVSLCRTGRKAEGLEWAERARQIDSEDAGVLYNVACVYALEGQVARALDCLEQTMHAGFGDLSWIERDPDLTSLRDEPRFRALLRA